MPQVLTFCASDVLRLGVNDELGISHVGFQHRIELLPVKQERYKAKSYEQTISFLLTSLPYIYEAIV